MDKPGNPFGLPSDDIFGIKKLGTGYREYLEKTMPNKMAPNKMAPNKMAPNSQTGHTRKKSKRVSIPEDVKQFCLRRAGNCCENPVCRKPLRPLTKIVPQFHHINGNPADNRPENIRVLCPDCHSTCSK